MSREVRCISCGRTSVTISEILGLCGDCIRADFPRWRDRLAGLHARVRHEDGLPEYVPRAEAGAVCRVCGNQCSLGRGDTGYCGLRSVTAGGRLNFLAGRASMASVSWYLDPLPTNCVADWVCAGGSSCGRPDYSYTDGPEYGYYNLAVFYEACSFNCIFCQNWHFRRGHRAFHRPDELAEAVRNRVSCICFFGGDPGPHMTHALAAARLARRRAQGRILRVCWETNGNISSKYLEAMLRESLETGGTIKVDIKMWSDSLSYALCGRSNRRTLEVVRRLLRAARQRPEPPLFAASTLLVPGYVDETEVRSVAEFIAAEDPETPYSLLAFSPDFLMGDMPTTSADHARRCMQTALEVGLKNVRIGNRHLLGEDYR